MKTRIIIDDPDGRFRIEISASKDKSIIMIEVSTEGVYFNAEQCLSDIGDKLLIYGASMHKLCGDVYIAYFINVPEFAMQQTLEKLVYDFPTTVAENCKALNHD